MDKTALIRKMEEFVKSYREQLHEHEGSTLTAVSTNAKRLFEGARKTLADARQAIMENEKAQSGLESLKEYMEKLEDAVKRGDKKMSAKTLEMMEEALHKFKTKDK